MKKLTKSKQSLIRKEFYRNSKQSAKNGKTNFYTRHVKSVKKGSKFID
jgi:hypothetical protein